MEGLLPKTVPQEEAEYLNKWLDAAIEEGVEIEMIYFSLIAMKKNPDLTVVESLLEGLKEWMP